LNIPDDANISTLLFSIKLPFNGITKTFMEMNKTNKISGRFDGDKLKIITSDPKFIKTVMIKEFSSFVNRDTDNVFFKCRSFKLLRSILFEKDEEWKNSRSLMSHTFTTARLKSMSNLINKCADNLDNYLDELTTNQNGILDAKKYVCYNIKFFLFIKGNYLC
jgi:cytochrome P450